MGAVEYRMSTSLLDQLHHKARRRPLPLPCALRPRLAFATRLLPRRARPLPSAQVHGPVHQPTKPRGVRHSIDELAAPPGAVAAALLQQAGGSPGSSESFGAPSSRGSPGRRRASPAVRLEALGGGRGSPAPRAQSSSSEMAMGWGTPSIAE